MEKFITLLNPAFGVFFILIFMIRILYRLTSVIGALVYEGMISVIFNRWNLFSFPQPHYNKAMIGIFHPLYDYLCMLLGILVFLQITETFTYVFQAD